MRRYRIAKYERCYTVETLFELDSRGMSNSTWTVLGNEFFITKWGAARYLRKIKQKKITEKNYPIVVHEEEF